MTTNKNLFLIIMLNIGLALLFPYDTFAGTCEHWIAKAVSVQGEVEVRRNDETQWQYVRFNDIFCPGDMVRVLEKSRAGFFLINEATIRLDQNTTVTFTYAEEKTTLINIFRGIAHFFSGVPRSLKITTPFVNGSAEGTEFVIKVDDDKAVISVYEGRVDTENDSGSLSITGGQSAVAEKDKAPVSYAVIRPRDAVQWALHYPTVFYHRPGMLPVEWQEKVTSLLSVGRVDEAEAEIKKILDNTPVNSDAFALQSIIAVVQNEKDTALKLANSAVGADPNSATAYIALSYALQAGFDLEGALNNIKAAVKLEPENALAWARVSELYLSFGYLDEALESADKAAAIEPDLSRTQSLLGFAFLSRIGIPDAINAFQNAIGLDQADPLPRLGLGLAMIREGKLERGRQEIEIAASLDPGNSLIRSYLGKAYYEEKQDTKAGGQFAAAEELDPLDPTPFFYDAIRKQGMNQPVEALHDLQKAISLNDNRAVYRSRQLLDEDLAARSVSLARIYNDLDFRQLALIEGWRSLSIDPGNYSAHRFLADSYSALPRHEIARVSELLQSQLLQPVNITPVRPQLAESDLFILSGTGPGETAFNEFNALFNRNMLLLLAGSIAGDNSTWGDELDISGII